MENETVIPKANEQTKSILTQQDSVCKTPAENARLLKLIQIFIEVDQTLKKKNHAKNQ